MANFDNAYKKTLIAEGGYSNDPADPGGETYRGISRHFHPDWEGWTIIDQITAFCARDELESRLDDTLKLQELIRVFYKHKFWDVLKGDEIPDQTIADKLFDTAVNCGVTRVVKFLQESLNLLNRNQGNYPDISIDGNMGPKTIEMISMLLQADGNPKYLLKMFNVFQGMHYINIMNSSEGLEIFARGWLNRL